MRSFAVCRADLQLQVQAKDLRISSCLSFWVAVIED